MDTASHGAVLTVPAPPPAAANRVREGAKRRWLFAVWATFFVALLAEAPGRMVFDTKLGVDMDPVGFLRRLWHLWNPLESMGRLDDQYVGYAFPMAPFYAVAHSLGVPTWITERAWMALIIAIGFWGLVRLAEALDLGTPISRLVAGACFALWPTFTILIGSTSAAVLPAVLAPWAILPLVMGSRGANPVKAAARSGFAVLCMGGVNGTVTLLTLIAPFLFLLTRTPGRRRRVLFAWWIPCVVAAVLWWLAPLLYMGRYGYSFLPYIETARTTTTTMSASSALRGAGNWTAYLHFGSPFLIAGWVMVASAFAVAGSGLIAALGLAGIARRDLPESRWLRLCLAVGAVGALIGYAGTFGGPLHGFVQHVLDGPGAPFRNVYKFEPLIGLVLCLGAAHLLGALESPFWQVQPLMKGAVFAVVALALCGSALPYLSGRVLQSGSFTQVPSYWQQTADYLAANAPRTDALLEPAASHGFYAWGSPIDEPLEPLGRSPWAHRYIAPIGSPGGQRMLDALETALAAAQPVPGLPAYLARAGIRYVVVRDDLDQSQFDSISPALIHRTLDLSGFTQVAHFGPAMPATPIRPGMPAEVAATVERFYAVEVYQATDPAQRPGNPAQLLPVADTVQLSGGPESLLQIAGRGLVDGRAVRLSGDVTTADPLGAGTPLVVADGLRRADMTFSLARDNLSYTYTAAETNPPSRADGTGGRPPRQILPFDGLEHQSIAVLDGAASVQASTFGSWLLESPQYDPVNAFDGDPATAWVEGDPTTPVGQWIQIGFDHPLDLPAQIGIRLLDDSVYRPIATRLKVTTDQGTVVDPVAADGSSQTLAVPPGRTGTLRVTIDAAAGGVPGGFGAGIVDVDIPGVHVTRYLSTPHDASSADRPLTYSFHRQTTGQALYSSGDPESGLYREFTLDTPATLTASISAVSLPGSALDSLLDSRRKPGDLHVTASPALGDLPGFRPGNLFDGSYLTGWVAGSDQPVIHVSWTGARTFDRLFLISPTGYAAPPLSVRITSPDGIRDAQVAADGSVRFPALTTDRFDVTFPEIASVPLYDPVAGLDRNLPLGLSEISVPELSGLRLAAIDETTRFDLPCGQGPALSVDGQPYQTSASGTFGDLIHGLPVTAHLCTAGSAVTLTAGTHRISAPASGMAVAVTDLTLSTAAVQTTSANRPMTIADWSAERRIVDVGPGADAHLEVHENQAKGWTATMNGHRLQQVSLDGWQQGYVIPAGPGGRVVLRYQPSTGYRLALVVGVTATVVLVVLAVAAGLLKRWDHLRAAGPRVAWTWPVVPIAGTLIMAAVGGPVAIAIPVLVLANRRYPRALPIVAFVAFAAASVISAVALVGPAPAATVVARVPGIVPAPLTAAAATTGPASGSGAFGPVAQLFALTALAAALSPYDRARRRSRR